MSRAICKRGMLVRGTVTILTIGSEGSGPPASFDAGRHHSLDVFSPPNKKSTLDQGALNLQATMRCSGLWYHSKIEDRRLGEALCNDNGQE